MLQPSQVESLSELLTKAKTALVVLGPNISLDQVAVATSLYLGLKNKDKDVSLLGVEEYGPPDLVGGRSQELSQIIGLSEMRNQLGRQNLVISFDYDEEEVDKVSYHIGEKTGKFYLTIKPKKGHEPLDYKNVEFAYAGAEADIVFLVGVHDLTTLEQLYYGYESLYEDSTVVTIHSFEPEIGNIKLDFSGKSSVSEVAVEFFEKLEIVLDSDMATNLIQGIYDNTAGLTSLSATADTFETIAKLLRAGGRRISKKVDQKKNEDTKEKSQSVKNKFEEILLSKTKEAVKVDQSLPVEKDDVSKKKATGGLKHQPGGMRK